MIKKGIKTYFTNLKHFFTPLGTFFLGVVIGLSILLPGSINLVKGLGDEVKSLITNTSLDFEAFGNSIMDSLMSLNWLDWNTSIKTLLDTSFVEEALDKGVHALAGGEYINYAEEIDLLITNTISGFAPLLVAFGFFSIVGLIGGIFLTKYLVRKEVAKRSFGKFLLVSLVDSILSTLVIAFIIWLTTVWKYSGIFVLLIGIIIFGLTSLFEAYLSHKTDKMKFKEIVNLKNSSSLAISNLLIFIISIIFIVVISLLTNPIIGVFVGVSFVEIAFVVISLNAEAYVKGLEESPVEETK